jgi:hypothetical protein
MALWQNDLLKAAHEHPLSAVHQNPDCGEEHCDRCQKYVRRSREHRKANS